jgi:hypothetical protein
MRDNSFEGYACCDQIDIDGRLSSNVGACNWVMGIGMGEIDGYRHMLYMCKLCGTWFGHGPLFCQSH